MSYKTFGLVLLLCFVISTNAYLVGYSAGIKHQIAKELKWYTYY